MPAHLARHMNTTHGAKPAGRRGPGRPAGSSKASRGPAWGANAGGVASDLLVTMQTAHGELAAQRDALDAQLSILEQAISTMGAPIASGGARRGGFGGGRRVGRPVGSGGARRGRPVGSGMRSGSLKSAIISVLQKTSRAMSPREIATAVKNSGYPTKSKDLTKAVSNALPDLKMVKKVGRGMYQA